MMGDLKFGTEYSWAGIVAAEPACNRFHEARKFNTPLLTLKGAESHYEPLPCETITRLYKAAGADSELVVLPSSNHYFSHNGKITRGLAFNGCGANPIVINKSGGAAFLDGSPVNRKIIRKKCFTKTGGSGKSREDLDEVVKLFVEFFERNIN